MIGEFLYALTGRDQQQPVIQRAVFRAFSSVAAAGINSDTSSAVPDDKIGIVTSLAIILGPGAAQTGRSFNVQIIDSLGNNLGLIHGDTTDPGVAAAIATQYGAQCEHLLMPGERLRCSTSFNAGAAANTVSFDAVVLLLPKGNIQLR